MSDTPTQNARPKITWEIVPDSTSWQNSIVVTVSVGGGETGETYRLALDFHDVIRTYDSSVTAERTLRFVRQCITDQTVHSSSAAIEAIDLALSRFASPADDKQGAGAV